MTSVLTNDAAFRTVAEKAAHEPAVRVLLNEELQRMWKDVFEQSKVVHSSAPNVLAREQGEDRPEMTAALRNSRLPALHEDAVGGPATKDGDVLSRPADAAPRPAQDLSGAGQGLARQPRVTADVQPESRLNATRAAARMGVESQDALPLSIGVRVHDAATPALAGRLTNAGTTDISTERAAVSVPTGRPLPMPGVGTVITAARVMPPARTASREVQDEHQAKNVQVTEQAEPVADEVVQVYHRDGLVAIVIRDLALGADVAVRCALETARQLAGDSRALRQVTLNGRSIFEGSGRGGASSGRDRPLVSFTC